jgi:predicted nucleic acid-binding protein
LRTLPIQIDHRTNENAWSATVEISDRLGLTPYDAAYLELALRLTFPLATPDRQLVQAGRAAKIPILGLTIGE